MTKTKVRRMWGMAPWVWWLVTTAAMAVALNAASAGFVWRYCQEEADERVAAVIADVGMQAQYETAAKAHYQTARNDSGGYTGGVDWVARTKAAVDPRIAQMQQLRRLPVQQGTTP